MIYSNFKYVNVDKLDLGMKTVFEYLKVNDLESFDEGSYEIDGDNIFVNRADITTVDRRERVWEAHKKYIDVHLIFDGTEVIDVNFIDNMKIIEFFEDKDFISCEGELSQSIVLRKGDFLLLNPEDAHKPCVKYKESEVVKKAIFKIKVN